jgi:hypothetical protein
MRLIAPAGFELVEGPCLGFRPLTTSSLPPIPLTQCNTAVGFQGFEIRLDKRENGFLPGHSYAFRLVAGNPRHWEDVQSRQEGYTVVSGANVWAIQLLHDATGVPMVLLEDIPQVLSFDTAALRPLDVPNIHDTSFRIFQRPITVQ